MKILLILVLSGLSLHYTRVAAAADTNIYVRYDEPTYQALATMEKKLFKEERTRSQQDTQHLFVEYAKAVNNNVSMEEHLASVTRNLRTAASNSRDAIASAAASIETIYVFWNLGFTGSVHQQIVGDLISILKKHQDPAARAHAAVSLAIIGDAAARPALQGATKDKSPEVQSAATAALKRLDSPPRQSFDETLREIRK